MTVHTEAHTVAHTTVAAAVTRHHRRHEVLALGAIALVAAPVVAGIAYAAAASLGIAGAGARGVDVARLQRVLAERATWEGLGFTLWIASLSTALAMLGAVAVAVAFRGAARTDRLARALATVSLPIPHLAAGLLGLWVLGQSGMLARLAAAAGLVDAPSQVPALVYDRPGLGVVLTMAWKEMAFLSVVAISLFATQLPAAEEAARTLGAGPWAVFRHVTWPMLWRGMLPAVVAVFIFAAGNYEIAALLAPSDPLALPLLVEERATDPDLARRSDAYVASLLLLTLAALAVMMHEWARARWEPPGE